MTYSLHSKSDRMMHIARKRIKTKKIDGQRNQARPLKQKEATGKRTRDGAVDEEQERDNCRRSKYIL